MSKRDPSRQVLRRLSKLKSVRKCHCGTTFEPQYRGQTMCRVCLDDIEHDANVEMFGADAEYLEYAGLADKIGNK